MADSVEIIIDDKIYKYSMTVAPPGDSLLVEQQKRDLLGALDLESFVQDLGRVGKCIRVAYNGIGAAGPEFQDLQIQVQRLGLDISKLCDKSAVTIASFKTSTRTILYELKAAYEFLIENREYMALDSFSTLAELAGKMAKAAENLQKEFEAQEVKVINTMEETQSRRAAEAIKAAELMAERERAEANMKRQEQLAKEHEKLEADYRAERREYERKEYEAMSGSTSFLERLANVVTSTIGLGNLFEDDSDREAKANRWQERSIEKFENEKEQGRLKQEALQSMAELIYEIKALEGKENLADIAVKALHKASGSMKFLIRLLRQAARFWDQLREHCLGLADDKLQQHIQKFVDRNTEQQRQEYWTSNRFKEKMFIYNCKWVALHQISAKYLEQIKLTQRDLYDYITENPTYDESRRQLQDLARDFEKDLESEHKRIEDRNVQADKNIRELKAIEN